MSKEEIPDVYDVIALILWFMVIITTIAIWIK